MTTTGRKALQEFTGKPDRKHELVAGSFWTLGEIEPLAWARSLKEREEAGEILSSMQQRLWREALK